jgi:hypothetical protein
VPAAQARVVHDRFFFLRILLIDNTKSFDRGGALSAAVVKWFSHSPFFVPIH